MDELSLQNIVDLVSQFGAALKKPEFLIAASSFFIGVVIKKAMATVPNWLIPSILSVLGAASGVILLGAAGASGWVAAFQGGLTGMTIALMTIGFYEVIRSWWDNWLQRLLFKAEAAKADPVKIDPPKADEPKADKPA